jgi:hypothetical protein
MTNATDFGSVEDPVYLQLRTIERRLRYFFPTITAPHIFSSSCGGQDANRIIDFQNLPPRKFTGPNPDADLFPEKCPRLFEPPPACFGHSTVGLHVD